MDQHAEEVEHSDVWELHGRGWRGLDGGEIPKWRGDGEGVSKVGVQLQQTKQHLLTEFG